MLLFIRRPKFANLSAISLRYQDEEIFLDSYTYNDIVVLVNHDAGQFQGILSLLLFGEIDLFQIENIDFNNLTVKEKQEFFVENFNNYINKEFFEKI